MSILTAIRREQKKVKTNLARLQHQLSGLEAAAKALGDSTSKEIRVVKKRVLSAAGRAAIAKAANSGGQKLGSRRRRQ